MGYLEEHLVKGERLIASAHKTMWIFLREAFMLVLAVVAYAVLGLALSKPQAGLYTAIGFFALFIILLISNAVKYNGTEVILTNIKVAGKSGALTVNVIEIILQNIDCVEIKQSAFGRLFKSGTINIVTHTRTFTYRAIAQPQEFVTAVNLQMAKVNTVKNKQKKVTVSFGLSPEQQKLGLAVSQPQNEGNPLPPQMPQVKKFNKE